MLKTMQSTTTLKFFIYCLCVAMIILGNSATPLCSTQGAVVPMGIIMTAGMGGLLLLFATFLRNDPWIEFLFACYFYLLVFACYLIEIALMKSVSLLSSCPVGLRYTSILVLSIVSVAWINYRSIIGWSRN